jgi:hypothetical protein
MSKKESAGEASPPPARTGKGVGDLKGIGIIGQLIGFFVLSWLLSISYYAVAFFALGMLPTIFAMVLDRGAGRFASKTVAACNFIGTMPFLADIAMGYEPSITAKDLMAEPITWLLIYGAALVGWMMIWMIPQTTLMIFTMRAEMKTKVLKEEQAKLLDEWGEEVKTGKSR